MTVLRPHPHRYEITRRLPTLDPVQDAHEIYRTTALYELPWDMRMGLNLAFYRPFAIPRIAGLLAHTGEFERQPYKRAMDTGLFMYELIEHGFDHARGREVVRALNRMHHRWDISNDDYLYVLATFVVIPSRWVDRHGWRPLLPVERAAATEFYGQLGRRMAIRGIPTTYEEHAELLDEYERENLGRTAAGERLMAATHGVVADRLPRRLRPLAGRMTAAILDEPVARAVGLRPAPKLVRVAADAALGARNVVLRRRAPAAAPWFRPGRSGTAVYPDGYEIRDLGPRDAAE